MFISILKCWIIITSSMINKYILLIFVFCFVLQLTIVTITKNKSRQPINFLNSSTDFFEYNGLPVKNPWCELIFYKNRTLYGPLSNSFNVLLNSLNYKFPPVSSFFGVLYREHSREHT